MQFPKRPHGHYPSARRLLAYGAAGASAGMIAFTAPALPNATAQVATQDITAADVTLDSQVVDPAGLISNDDSVREILAEAQRSQGLQMFLVFTDRRLSPDPETFATELRESQAKVNNALVVVISNNAPAGNGQVGMSAGERVPDARAIAVRDALQSTLSDNVDFSAAAQAAAKAAAGSGNGSVVHTDSDGNSAAWLGAAGIALVGGGGGAWLYSRRRTKANEEKQLEAARAIAPEDSAELAGQPTHVLRTLAKEELESTDHSIRKGSEELEVAVSEFGEERTREFSKALHHSRVTLNKAYSLHQRIVTGLVQDEQEERQLLVEIVSSCGEADDTLDAQAEAFAELRQKLIDAPRIVDELVRQTISLRSRVPSARDILTELGERVDPALLHAITDNPDVAESEIAHADKALDQARELLGRPAGQQGGLVDAIGSARVSIRQADSQLLAVERAETRLAEARQKLHPLIDEVAQELIEARQLADSGATGIDYAALSKATTQAEQALTAARERGEQDPLTTYSDLLEADGVLDIQLEEAKGAHNDFTRIVDMVDRTTAQTELQLRGVEETINNRGRIIGVETRTAAQAARDALTWAVTNRTTAPKQALQSAHTASHQANQAAQYARRDIDAFNARNRPRGGGGGDLLTGVVLGSLLSGGGGFGGGQSGGFGGGGGGGFGSFGGDSFGF